MSRKRAEKNHARGVKAFPVLGMGIYRVGMMEMIERWTSCCCNSTGSCQIWR
jgi:hypothetical protein